MRNQDPCKRIRPLIEPFLDGELPSVEQQEVKAELNRCESCRREFERLSVMRSLIREVYVEEIRAADLSDLLPGILNRVEREPVGLRQQIRNWFERYRLGLVSPAAAMGVAAMAMVAVMGGTLVYVSQTGDGEGERSGIPSMVAQNTDEADVVEADLVVESAAEEEAGLMAAAPVLAVPSVAPNPRLFRPNESFVTYYAAETGTVIVDSDPEGEAPTVVWHFQEEGDEPVVQEDGQI